MESTKLNTILSNSNLLCRKLSTIDIGIIAYSMVLAWKDTNINPPNPMHPTNFPHPTLEMRRNQYVKIFVNIINALEGTIVFDSIFDLITGLIDNFNYLNNLPSENIYLNTVGCRYNSIVNNLYSMSNINLSLFNKLLYEESYIFFKNYFNNGDENENENISNTNNYVSFLSSHLKKSTLSKSDLSSVYLGMKTYGKINTVCMNINREKIIENLSINYYISDDNTLCALNKLFAKHSNNENINIDYQSVNYKLVYEVINWCALV